MLCMTKGKTAAFCKEKLFETALHFHLCNNSKQRCSLSLSLSLSAVVNWRVSTAFQSIAVLSNRLHLAGWSHSRINSAARFQNSCTARLRSRSELAGLPIFSWIHQIRREQLPPGQPNGEFDRQDAVQPAAQLAGHLPAVQCIFSLLVCRENRKRFFFTHTDRTALCTDKEFQKRLST